MANFILNSTARFRPFSFQEMLAPVSIYTKAYNEVEDGIAELSAKANVWEGLANEQTDKKTYAKYKSFANELNKQAELLAKEGLNPSSRQNMLKMKQRYSSDIVPIENAYKRRQELIDEQRKLIAQDSTMMFNKDASTISLDDLIDNPTTTYLSYSGADLAKQVRTAASALAKEIGNNPRKWRSILDDSYYETITQKGIPSDIIAKFLYNADDIIYNQRNPEEFGINNNIAQKLIEVLEAPLAASGIRNWKNTMSKSDWKELLPVINNYARQGLWGAVGETQYQTLSNKDYNSTGDKNKGKNVEDSRLPYRAIPRTKVEDLPTTKMGEDLKYVKGLKDGSIPLNEMKYRESGYRIPVKNINPFTLKYQNNNQQRYNYTEEQLKRLKDTYGTNNLDELEKIIQSQINESAIRDFTYSMNYPDNKLVSKVLSENSQIMSRNGKLPIYELNEDKNIKGKQLSNDDLSDINFDNGILDYDPTLGLRFTYTNKDGKTKKVVIDTEVLDNKDRRLASYQEEINKARINKDYDSMNKLIYLYMSQLDGTFNSLAKIQSNTDSNLIIR